MEERNAAFSFLPLAFSSSVFFVFFANLSLSTNFLAIHFRFFKLKRGNISMVYIYMSLIEMVSIYISQTPLPALAFFHSREGSFFFSLLFPTIYTYPIT
jgi:ABC-type transport system involved in cytochrome bd biosynthesis fused ATPase/permease subunit